jgi:voltage-gated potassium channel Kch
MTTVGYGDITPKTTFGRVVAILAAFVGTLLISLIIASVTNFIVMNDKEQHAVTQIEKEKSAI